MILKQDFGPIFRIILILGLVWCVRGFTQNGSDIEVFSQTIKEMKPGGKLNTS